uniref:Uncharacterized protein n=1 Tax=Astyanax mexicanus TaxID=7994 RepID=A0A8B9HV72_ASTMX
MIYYGYYGLFYEFILSSVFTTEAMSLSDPVTCYILDAVLLLYCIIFTALYFRIKVRLAYGLLLI